MPSTPAAAPLRLFRAAPVSLLRAPVLPKPAARAAVPPGVDAASPEAHSPEADSPEALAGYVRELWRDRLFREAVIAARPDFSACVERILRPSGSPPKSAKIRRIALTLTKYRLRMSSRPTPFGLMAGVTLARSGDVPAGRLGTRHQSWTRPDMVWLMAVVTGLEADPGISPALRVLVCPGLTRCGSLVIMPCPSPGSLEDTRTLPVGPLENAAITAARSPVPFAVAVAAVRRAVSRDDGLPAEVDAPAVVRRLVADQVLLTDLRPPPDQPDPLGHVLGRLSAMRDHPVVAELRRVQQAIAEVDRRQAGERAAELSSLRDRMRRLHCTEHTLHTDLALDAEICLPAVIGDEIAQAAEVLWHLTSAPPGKPYLRAYRQKFLARYGTDRLVPLLDLLSAETGLGIPAPDRDRTAGPGQAATAAAEGIRARELLRIAADAHRRRVREVVLDDALVGKLRLPERDYRQAPASAEIYADLLSPSMEALRSSDFRLVVANVPREPAGTSFGRFAYLLDDDGRSVRELFRTSEGYAPDAERVGLCYWPTRADMANIALVAPCLDRYIAVGTGNLDTMAAQISLGELAVAADQERLYLVSATSGREIVATQSHAAHSLLAPGIARFLRDLASEGIRLWRQWDWGPADSAGFLPRLRYGKTVLHPATWRMDGATTEAARTHSPACWDTALAAWRQRLDVPSRILLRNSDKRIPLDLDDSFHRGVLQQEVARGLRLTLTELPGGEDYPDGWLTGPAGSHHAELIFPLHRREYQTPGPQQKPALAPRAREPIPIRKSGDGLHDPGGDWLYAKIYTSARCQQEVLSGRLRPVIPDLLRAGQVDRWFYIRYADPEPHIRLRFHGAQAALWSQLLPILRDWTTDLRQARLASHMTLDAYDQELERYGGPEAIAAAEEAFTADSGGTLDMLDVVGTGQIDVDHLLLGALSVVDLLRVIFPADDALRFATWAARQGEYRSAFAARRQDAIDLADAGGAWDRLRQYRGGPDVVKAWERREPSLLAYRAKLEALTRSGSCWASAGRIRRSLLHMHCNRLFGTDRDSELSVYAIAGNALRCQEARRRARQAAR